MFLTFIFYSGPQFCHIFDYKQLDGGCILFTEVSKRLSQVYELDASVRDSQWVQFCHIFDYKQLDGGCILFTEVSKCLSQVYELDASVHDSQWLLEAYVNTTQQFVRDHPDFIGAKFIYTTIRQLNILSDCHDVQSSFDTVILFNTLHFNCLWPCGLYPAASAAPNTDVASAW